jgi:hypothetical protein
MRSKPHANSNGPNRVAAIHLWFLLAISLAARDLCPNSLLYGSIKARMQAAHSGIHGSFLRMYSSGVARRCAVVSESILQTCGIEGTRRGPLKSVEFNFHAKNLVEFASLRVTLPTRLIYSRLIYSRGEAAADTIRLARSFVQRAVLHRPRSGASQIVALGSVAYHCP